MIRCPCCNKLTIDDTTTPITEICDVCYWQYDEVAQRNENSIIGPNNISLNQAKKNYKLFGASEYKFINLVRKPTKEEI